MEDGEPTDDLIAPQLVSGAVSTGRFGGRTPLALLHGTMVSRSRTIAALTAIAGILSLVAAVVETDVTRATAQELTTRLEIADAAHGSDAGPAARTPEPLEAESDSERGLRLFGAQSMLPSILSGFTTDATPTTTEATPNTESASAPDLAAATPPSVAAPPPTTSQDPTPVPTEVPSPTPPEEPTATPTEVPPPTPFGVSSVPRPTATTPPTAEPFESGGVASHPAPFGQTGSWRLAFSDEFDGSQIDTSVWETGWFSSSGFSRPVNNNGDACFHPDQVSVSGGNLVLRVDDETDPACVKKDGTTPADYVGALVNTRETFTFSYGYAEARIFLPSTNGRLHNWPAFWHTGFDWPETGEVDIAEGLSGGQPCSAYHYAGPAGEHLQDKSCVNWTEPGGWHVFAANWEPGSLTFYFDYVEVFRTTEGVTGDPHYLIFDFAVNEDYGVVTGTEMLVDYVHVWQLLSP